MLSGLVFPCDFNGYCVDAVSNFSLKDNYPSSVNYIADSIIYGIIDPNSGEYSTNYHGKYSDIMDTSFNYELLANSVMEDKSLVITSALWDTFSKVLSGKFSSIDGEVRQEQIYEAFLMDYLTFSEGSTENSTTLDKMSDFADKTMKYENKIIKQLLEKGIASDEKELIQLIENSDSLNNPKLVEAMKELNWEKKLEGYTEIASGITEVTTNAAEYFEALTKAMALKEVNDERIAFLKSMAENASDNEAFQTAVKNLIKTIESSYAEISIQEAADTMGTFAWDKCWDSIKKQIPYFSIFDNAHDAMNYMFDSDSLSENNIRIIMQYTAGQYAKQVLMAAYSAYKMNPTEENASAFVEAYKNYLAYQGYSSEWTKKFVENIPSSNEESDKWLTKLNSDINYCNNCIIMANNLTKVYDSNVYDEDNASENNNIETTFNGNSYQIFDISMTWTKAESYCENLGGHLVSITTQEEQDYITKLLNSHANTQNCYWIGLYGSNNNWQWVDGGTAEYYNWAPNEPNNQDSKESYVHLFGNVWTGGNGIKEIGQWNDASNDGAGYSHDFYDLEYFGFICEWDNTANSDENESSETSGDCNDDGIFNIADVVLLQKWLLSTPDIKLSDWKAADFCEDGVLDVFDLCLMKRKLIID